MNDPSLRAVVIARVPLHYAEGADAQLDRPAHIRAGSSLARTRDGIALVQDDANFVGIFENDGTRVRAIVLPAGAGGRRQFDDRRGNKKHKLDLEACVAIEEDGGTLLIALGSGSTTRRESIAIVRWCESERPDVSVVHAPRLYDALRNAESFAGSELNIEGAVRVGDRLRLFGRGNGAARRGVQPVNATCDLDWPAFLAHLRAPDESPPPTPTNIVRYELVALDGIALSFTDATLFRDAVLFSATAEDSPDVTRDGRVTGSAIGMIERGQRGGGGRRNGRTRWTPITEPSGALFTGKVEGLVPAGGTGDRLFIVVDADDPDAASELCTVQLHGTW